MEAALSLWRTFPGFASIEEGTNGFCTEANGETHVVCLNFNGTGAFTGFNIPPYPSGGNAYFMADGAAAFALKSSPYTLTVSDSWINVTGTTTITVPHALTGQRWVVFNSGSNTVTIQPDSGTINGAASVTRSANTGYEVTCDGTNCFAH